MDLKCTQFYDKVTTDTSHLLRRNLRNTPSTYYTSLLYTIPTVPYNTLHQRIWPKHHFGENPTQRGWFRSRVKQRGPSSPIQAQMRTSQRPSVLRKEDASISHKHMPTLSHMYIHNSPYDGRVHVTRSIKTPHTPSLHVWSPGTLCCTAQECWSVRSELTEDQLNNNPNIL